MTSLPPRSLLRRSESPRSSGEKNRLSPPPAGARTAGRAASTDSRDLPATSLVTGVGRAVCGVDGMKGMLVDHHIYMEKLVERGMFNPANKKPIDLAWGERYLGCGTLSIGSLAPMERLGLHVPSGVESATEWDLVDGAMAQAMGRARVKAEELDCIIHISPTIAAPTSSATVGFQDTMRRFQREYAIRPDCGLYHLHNGCDGVLPALYLADSLIRSGQCRRVLILTSVCGESLRHAFYSVLERNDMNAWISALLFGDAATALVLDASADGLDGGDTYFEVDGLMRVTDAKMWIARYEQVTTAMPYLTINPMAAKMLFVDKLREILGEIDSPLNELDGIVMHQPNSKLVQLINRTVLKGQSYSVVDVANKYGNLVCSSAVTNLCEALAAEEAEGRVVPEGAKTLLFTLGADVGMTYGGCMLTRYTKPVN